MRPRPSNYVAWGSTAAVTAAYEKAKDEMMVKRDTRWTLVFDDLKSADFDLNILYVLASRITFICAMSFDAFPLDVQTCLLQVSASPARLAMPFHRRGQRRKAMHYFLLNLHHCQPEAQEQNDRHDEYLTIS